MSEHKESAGLAGIILVFVAITAVVFYEVGFYSGSQAGQLIFIEKHIKEQQK